MKEKSIHLTYIPFLCHYHYSFVCVNVQNMMAHIRYATQGEVSLENVHPFVRVWKGIQVSFAHNGECPHFAADRLVLLGKATADTIMYHPVGDTDSEAVFCSLLNAMSAEFVDGLPTLPVLHEFLQTTCTEIVTKHHEYISQPNVKQEPIILNFLMGFGPYNLFAYSMPGKRPGSSVWNGLHYIVRSPPFSTAKLLDDDYQIDFSTVTTPSDCVSVITTKPLTCEKGWNEFHSGQLILFNHGMPYLTSTSCMNIDQTKHGLHSKTVPVVYRHLEQPQPQQISSNAGHSSPKTTAIQLIENTTADITLKDERDDQIVEVRSNDSSKSVQPAIDTTACGSASLFSLLSLSQQQQESASQQPHHHEQSYTTHCHPKLGLQLAPKQPLCPTVTR